MVQKAVAGVGALLTGVGLIMLIVVAVTETFVLATIPGSPCTEDNPLGKLGVFTATFDPACAQGTGNPALARYDALEKSESATTEFWPLFPAQNNFGGAFGDTLPEFTTCNEFYTSPASLVTTVTAAALQAFPGLEANIQAGAVQTTGLGTTVFNGLPTAINTFAASALVTAVPQALTGLNATIPSIISGLAGLRGALAGTPFPSAGFACTPSSATLAMPTYTGCGIEVFTAAPAPDSVNGNLANALGIEAAGGNGFTPAFYNAVGLGLGGGAVEGEAAVKAVAGVLGLHASASLVNIGTVTIDALPGALFGGVNLMASFDAAADFSDVRTALTALAGVPGAPSSITGAAFALNYCPSQDSVQLCLDNNVTDITPPLLNDATPIAFCILGLQDPVLLGPALALNNVTATNCTYTAVLLSLKNIPEALIQAGLSAVPAFAPLSSLITSEFTAALSGVIAQCAAGPLSLTDCLNFVLNPPGDAIDFAQETGPLNYSWTAQALRTCVGSQLQGFPCPAPFGLSVRGLVAATISNPATADATAGALNGLFNGVCPNGTADTTAECQAVIASGVTTAGWIPLSGGVFSNANVPADFDERVAACEDDNKDIEIFETAQAMIPAAMALAGLGAILAGVGAALNKTPVAAVAAVICIASGALTMGALLLIQTAPVYKLVGGDEVPNVPYYSASTGQILALLGAVLPLLGGVAVAIGAFLNRPGASSEMTSKVDNTY